MRQETQIPPICNEEAQRGVKICFSFLSLAFSLQEGGKDGEEKWEQMLLLTFVERRWR